MYIWCCWRLARSPSAARKAQSLNSGYVWRVSSAHRWGWRVSLFVLWVDNGSKIGLGRTALSAITSRATLTVRSVLHSLSNVSLQQMHNAQYTTSTKLFCGFSQPQQAAAAETAQRCADELDVPRFVTSSFPTGSSFVCTADTALHGRCMVHSTGTAKIQNLPPQSGDRQLRKCAGHGEMMLQDGSIRSGIANWIMDFDATPAKQTRETHTHKHRGIGEFLIRPSG